MLADDIASPNAITPADLWRRYVDAVTAAARAAGPDRVRAVTDLGDDTVESLIENDRPPLALDEAAAILALENGEDPVTELDAIRDRLLFDMSTAILDVETLAADLDLDLDPQEIQRRVEGRESLTLEEYAHLRIRIARGLR